MTNTQFPPDTNRSRRKKKKKGKTRDFKPTRKDQNPRKECFSSYLWTGRKITQHLHPITANRNKEEPRGSKITEFLGFFTKFS